MKEEKPVISIVVPIYKIQEVYLRQCIDALIGQTLKQIEIILVDDGSPDNAGSICEEYAAEDDRIVTIHQQNQGVSVARNAGIDAARGEYLMFVDPDDWLELDCCERVLEALKGQESNACFFQRCEEHEATGKSVYFSSVDSTRLTKADIKEIQLNILKGYSGINRFGFDGAAPWGMLIKRAFIDDNALRFPLGVKKAQDVLFRLYMYECLDCAYYFHYTGYHWRIHGESVCHRYNEQMPQIIETVLKKAVEFIQKYHDGESEWVHAVGVRSIVMLGTLENTMLFHAQSKRSRKQIIQQTRDYLDNDVVRKYGALCEVKDFETINGKIRYALIRSGQLNLYYVVMRLYYLNRKDC